MSTRSQNCGCGASGKKARSEASGSGYSSYYADKENKSISTQRYLEAMPASRTHTVRERVIEHTSSNTMFRSVTHTTQTTYTSYLSVPHEKPSATRLRQPLTDVNEKYSSQRPSTKRPSYPSTLVTSTARRPGSAASSRTTQRAYVPLASSTQLSATSSSSSSSSASSSQYPYSTINDSELAYRTAELSSTASFRTSDDLRSFYSAVSNDDTWLTCKTANEESFRSVPYKEKYLAPSNSRQPMSQSSPYTDCRSDCSLIINDGMPSLRKKTLKRDVNKPSEYMGIVNIDPHTRKVHPRILYSDYIIEIIENLLTNQEKHVLESHFITNFDVRTLHRAAVINWLVKLQQFLGSDPGVLFMAVRLFDKMLSITEIPPDLLQLVGLAAYWIASKYSDIIDVPLASKLLQLCNNAYTVRALWKIENKVLRYLHFNIAVDEPIIFVRYYIYVMQLHDSNIVSICSNYLLDCLLLDSECNVYPISFQAAAAVLLSLRLLDLEVRLWNLVEPYPGYYAPEQLRTLQTKILVMVNLVQDSNYPFREPYSKYATEKYASISLKLSEILNAL